MLVVKTKIKAIHFVFIACKPKGHILVPERVDEDS